MPTILRSWVPALALIAGCTPILGSEPDLESDLERAFREYTIVQLGEGATEDMATSGHLSLPMTSAPLELVLVPRELLSSRYRALYTDGGGLQDMAPPDLVTYKGTIAGDPTTQVRLATTEAGIAGTFVLGEERFYVEPAVRYSRAATRGTLVVYQAGDAREQVDMACEHLDEQFEEGLGVVAQQAHVGTSQRVIELATDADHELVTARGGAAQANAETLQILNMVEGVYEAELGITFDVVLQHAWTVPDPYSTASKVALLDSFIATWESSFPRGAYPRDLAHLFSASPVINSAGYGKLDVICRSPQNGYAVSGFIDYEPARVLIAAHEIAHNVGANHRDAGGCENTIMNAQLTYTTPLTFCPASRGDLGAAVASHGSCISTVIEPSPIPVVPRTRFDFTGDGSADLSVFRPETGTWYVAAPGGFTSVQWGASGDRLVAADYDDDGKTDHAVFRNGVWWRLYSTTGLYDAVEWGVPSDTPVPADFDGDGRADLAIYRPEGGEWWVQKSSDGSNYAISWGSPEDLPITGDFDGDRRADYIVFRPSDSTWYLMSSASYTVSIVQWGVPGDVPLAADFDGDRRVDVAVYRPSDHTWYVIQSRDSSFLITAFGADGDVPVPADYDGTGRAEVAVFRPTTNEWHLRSDFAYTVTPFGAPGDLPVPARN